MAVVRQEHERATALDHIQVGLGEGHPEPVAKVLDAEVKLAVQGT